MQAVLVKNANRMMTVASLLEDGIRGDSYAWAEDPRRTHSPLQGVCWADTRGLARAADIGRVTLVRLEKGEQTPRFKTLDAIAKALGIRAPELLVEPEWLLK